jgi:ATP phosphoribosyltransferase regulatory subunit
MASFAARGYQRVKPPLLEFEESLLSGDGSAMAAETFRLMDPVSQRMMGLRADMTLQVARIATIRLAGAPRPLRLAYGGQVLRVKGTQLRPERQFGQVGAELIGSAAPAADAEVILMAVEALRHVGVAGLSVDLGLPTLVPAVCAGLNLDPETEVHLRAALDRKDAAAIKALKSQLGSRGEALLSAMLAASGPAEESLDKLAGLDLPGDAPRERAQLAAVVEGVRAGAPDLGLTIDPVENRGFEYHTGVTFTLFALNVRGELGRGGRYRAGQGDQGDKGDKGDRGEPATGLTLFTDTLLRALPPAEDARRLFLPAGTSAEEGSRWREEGWNTVLGLEPVEDGGQEAQRLKCTHLLVDGQPRELKT